MLYAQCADVTHVHSFLLKRQPRVAARPTRIGKTDRKVLHSWSSVTTGTPTVSGCRPCANAHLKIRWGPQVQAYSPICVHTGLVLIQQRIQLLSTGRPHTIMHVPTTQHTKLA